MNREPKMTRISPIIALLLLAACDRQDSAPPSNEAAAETPASAVKAEVPSIQGDWRIVRIGPQDAAGLGMAAAFASGNASISTGCLRRAWTYTQDRNLVAFTSSPGGSSNCGRTPNATEETAYAVLDDANIVIFSKDGKEASLSGTGGTLSMERR
jgi:hypothetical protein